MKAHGAASRIDALRWTEPLPGRGPRTDRRTARIPIVALKRDADRHRPAERGRIRHGVVIFGERGAVTKCEAEAAQDASPD